MAQPAKQKAPLQNGPVEQRGYISQPKTEKIYYVDIITTLGTIRVGLFNETPLHRDNFIKLVREGLYDSTLFHRVINGFMIQGGDPLSKRAKPNTPLGMGDVGYKIPAEIVPGIYHKRGALAMARDNNPEKASNGSQFYIVQGKRMTAKELEQVINGVNTTKKTQFFKTIMESDSIQTRLADFRLRGDSEGQEAYVKSLQPIIDKLFAPYFFEPDPIYVQMYVSQGGAPHLDRDYTVFGEVVSGMEVVDAIAAMQVDAFYRPVTNVGVKMKLVNP